MEHFASSSFNGSTITIAKGDTLTLVLRYGNVEGQRTQWSYRDNYSFNRIALIWASFSVEDGAYTTIFKGRDCGVVEIALFESTVLGLDGPSSIMSKYRLRVVVQ